MKLFLCEILSFDLGSFYMETWAQTKHKRMQSCQYKKYGDILLPLDTKYIMLSCDLLYQLARQLC